MKMQGHEQYMRLALAEAVKAQGRTSPNPLVGAVIVKDDQIIATGYHHKAGTAHAEINALRAAGEAARGASIYVTLEPCNHTGRTPPCSQALIKAGVTRVYIGMADPHALAKGGAETLREAGIEVHIGLLEKDCQAINYPFIHHVSTGRPWVVMKGGMSLDGKITAQAGRATAITGPASKAYTHSLRDRLDAILVGIETVLADDPSLTSRLSGGGGQDPLRLILDTHLRMTHDALMLRQDSLAETWIYCSQAAIKEKASQVELLTQAGAQVHPVQTSPAGHVDLMEILDHLGKNGITSVLVEGGSHIHAAFLQENLVNEVYLFYAPFFIGGQGLSLVNTMNMMMDKTSQEEQERRYLDDIQVEQLEKDTLIHGILQHAPGCGS